MAEMMIPVTDAFACAFVLVLLYDSRPWKRECLRCLGGNYCVLFEYPVEVQIYQPEVMYDSNEGIFNLSFEDIPSPAVAMLPAPIVANPEA